MSKIDFELFASNQIWTLLSLSPRRVINKLDKHVMSR